MRLIFGIKTSFLTTTPLISSFRIPNLVGMLLITILFRNLPWTGEIMTWLSLESSG